MPYILTALIGFAVLFLAWIYAEWEEWDDYRRLERRAHRNLMSQGGKVEVVTRYVTPSGRVWEDGNTPDPTPADTQMEDPERYRIYRLCDGNLELVATCGTKEAVGVALVTLASEGEFEKCPVGLMDRPAGQESGTWLIRPWLPFPTPKNVSDAGRVLNRPLTVIAFKPTMPEGGTMPTTDLGTARGFTVYGGEEGFEMHLSTTEGEFVVNVHSCSENLLEEVEREIGSYWQEARSAMSSAKILPFADDADAYDPSDPKHPNYHSTHADLWDAIDRGDVRAISKRIRS